MRDPYLYEDVDVLRNLLNIKEEKLLETACIFERLIASIWQVHPFREGNTRSVITFATQFAYAHGFGMDKQLLRKSIGYVRDALVKASDGQYSEDHYLSNIFKDSIFNG